MSKKIAFILPRNLYFGPSRATSIDLVVHDLATHLPPDVRVTIYAQAIPDPYTDVPVTLVPKKGFLKHVAAHLKQNPPDGVVVEQHLPSAVTLARLCRDLPVVLHTHAFPKVPQHIWTRALYTWRYRHMKKVLCVSAACADVYQREYAARTQVPVAVVGNGVDLATWSPRESRDNTVLYVGRLAPEKGVLELAQALARILPQHPDWCAVLVMTGRDVHPAYRDRVLNILDQMGAQVEMRFNQPWPEIQTLNESAAIAVVPSIYLEAFGRTALEALAGGAALISSTRGGLSDVVGQGAVRLDGDITADILARALSDLIRDPARRAALATAGQAQARQFDIHAQAAALCAQVFSV